MKKLDIKQGQNPKIDLPKNYDFRDKHGKCITEIRNQGSCGSCWAHSATEVLQERICLVNGKNEMLSVQDPVSCSKKNKACDGGYPFHVWEYLKNNGTVSEECFPYTSGNKVVPECRDTCVNNTKYEKHKIISFQRYVGEEEIKTELDLNGPVDVSFDVYDDFYNYKGGIYQHVSGGYVGGHGVVAVGFGEENGIKYWICQNSWGPRWGENGFFKIKVGECDIDDDGYAGVTASSKFVKLSLILFALVFALLL